MTPEGQCTYFVVPIGEKVQRQCSREAKKVFHSRSLCYQHYKKEVQAYKVGEGCTLGR